MSVPETPGLMEPLAPLHDLHDLSVISPLHAFRITHELRYCASVAGVRRPSSAPLQHSCYAAITTPPSGLRWPTAGAVTETRRQLPLPFRVFY